MGTTSVRYLVDDVDAAVDFYTTLLGFEVQMRPGPGFAALKRDDLRLLLNAPGSGGAGQTTPRGIPEPGGWNRFQLQVDDLVATVQHLRDQRATFDGKIITGNGGNRSCSWTRPATSSSCLNHSAPDLVLRLPTCEIGNSAAHGQDQLPQEDRPPGCL